MILLTPQISFGTTEIVVKSYDKDKNWVLVRKDSFDFFINEITVWKTKYERSVEVRDKERESLLLEREVFKSTIEALSDQAGVYHRELVRLNAVVDSLQLKGMTKDVILALSIMGNIAQAVK
jgi:hypothetical protein